MIDFMKKVIRMLIRQITAYPVSSIFIIIGFVISLTLISFGTTSIIEMAEKLSAKLNYEPQNAIKIRVSLHKDIEEKDVLSLFGGISENTGVIFNNIYSFIDKLEDRGMIAIEGEYYSKDIVRRYPLLKGRYYTRSELNNGDNVVLIGKELEKYSEEKGKEKIIMIQNIEYKVIGIIGEREKKSILDYKVVMPITSIPEVHKDRIKYSKELDFTIHSNYGDTYKDYKIIRQNINMFDATSSIEENIIENDVDIVTSILSRPSMQVSLSVLVYIFSIINCINLTSYWINKRRYEIGVRKAFGQTNFDIIYLLFKEMLIISVFSYILSLIIQLFLKLFFTEIIGMQIEISVTHFLTSAFFVLLSSVLTVIIPALKSIKMQPVDAMKV